MRIDFSQTRRSCVARPAAGRRRCGEDADRSAAQRGAAFSGERTLSDYIKSGGKLDDRVFAALQVKNEHIESATNGKTSFEGADESTKRALRIDAFLVGATIDKLGKAKAIADADEAASLKVWQKSRCVDQVHTAVGEGRDRGRARTRHDDRLEANRRDRRRAHRQVASHLRRRGVCRYFRTSGQRDARTLVRSRRHDGC